MKRKSFDIHIEFPSTWDWLNFIEKLLIGIAVILTAFVVVLFVDEALSKTTTDTIHVVTFTDSRRYEFYEVNDWFKSIKEDDIITYYIYKTETPMLHIKEEVINNIPYDERNK